MSLSLYIPQKLEAGDIFRGGCRAVEPRTTSLPSYSEDDWLGLSLSRQDGCEGVEPDDLLVGGDEER